MQPWQFYSKHLEKVSRSFSFCIAQLSSPQREWVALAYLLFRVADTIEDSAWTDTKQQQDIFSLFESVLIKQQDVGVLHGWQDAFPQDIEQGERFLLEDTSLLVQDLFSLPDNINLQMIKNLCQMMAGMRYFLSNHAFQGILSLQHITDLNQYCFFVAGIVGELLTFIFSDILNTEYDECLRLGFHFGLFLQKINILKDQILDESLGRQFIASRDLLKQSVIKHAGFALTYILAISPTKGREYRLFCAWSLFIGLASLKWIEKQFVTGKRYKIPYVETMSIVYKLNKIVGDDDALKVLFSKYVLEFTEQTDTQDLSDAKKIKLLPNWFQEIYPSDILSTHAEELGLV